MSRTNKEPKDEMGMHLYTPFPQISNKSHGRRGEQRVMGGYEKKESKTFFLLFSGGDMSFCYFLLFPGAFNSSWCFSVTLDLPACLLSFDRFCLQMFRVLVMF